MSQSALQHLVTLPQPVLEKILLQAGAKSAASLSATCSQLRRLVQFDNELWSKICHEMFGEEFQRVDGSLVRRRHADHAACRCLYFVYDACLRWVCSVCDAFVVGGIGGGMDDGFVCAECWRTLQAKGKFYES